MSTFKSKFVQPILSAARSNRTVKNCNVGTGATVSVNRLVDLLGETKIPIPKCLSERDYTFANIDNIKSEPRLISTI